MYFLHICYDGMQTAYALLFCDSSVAIAINRQHADSGQSRHIDVCYHYVREAVQKGEFVLMQFQTQLNPADFFTKPLSTEMFCTHTLPWCRLILTLTFTHALGNESIESILGRNGDLQANDEKVIQLLNLLQLIRAWENAIYFG